MKELIKLEHLQFEEEFYTRAFYYDKSFDWCRGWHSISTFAKANHLQEKVKHSELEDEYQKMILNRKKEFAERLKKENEGAGQILPVVNPLTTALIGGANENSFIDSGLSGKLFAKLLIRTVQDKTFTLKGETYNRDRLFEFTYGEHILPNSLLNAIQELIMQRGIEEITINRFHWNVSEEKGL